MTATAGLRCRHFGQCGGCTALDRPIAEQRARKRRLLLDVLGTGLGPVPLHDPPPAPAPPRFDRCKLAYPAQPAADGSLRLGLYERGSHALVEIAECQLQLPALTEFGLRAGAVLRRHGVRPYDETGHRAGWLRALHARVAPGTGELLVGITTTGDDAGVELDAVADALWQAARDLPAADGVPPVHAVGLVRSVRDEPGNYLLGPTCVALRGRDHVFDHAGGLRFRIGFRSFYQVHRDAEAVLYRPALGMVGDVTDAVVVDGYGGVGTFGLRLAAAGARRVHVVEEHAAAADDAAYNAAANDLGGRVAVHAAAFAAGWDAPARSDVVVVDPPRRGMSDDAIEHVLQLAPRRLLYVSCSAASLARDLAALAPRYRPRAARWIDLFPHTNHVEVAVLLAAEGG